MATARSAQPNGTSHSSLCPCATARRVSRSVTQLYDIVLAPVGLKSTQYVLLRILAEEGAIPQWKIAQENSVAVETLSRRLAPLRNKGLIALEVSGSRGEHIYRLTPEGRVLLDKASPYWSRAEARLQQVLGAEDLTSFVASMNRLSKAAQDATDLRTSNK